VAHPCPSASAITGSVCADADLAEAVEAIATAADYNAGQDCTAASRVLVHEAMEVEFHRRLTAHVQTIRTGQPDDEDVRYGPLIKQRQLDNVAGFVDRLPEHATVLAGGHRVGSEGFFYAPTVVSALRQDDEIVQSEIFGPVVTTQVFSAADEAYGLANGACYGLASSVFTHDHRRAMRASRELSFGSVWISTDVPLVAEMPRGDFQHSGHGKDLSMYGLDEYTRIKYVMSYAGAS
jgi:betaine-aldehyde dehydrogenase